MATVSVCDKCGEIVRGSVPLGGVVTLQPSYGGPAKNRDLCMTHFNELLTWLGITNPGSIGANAEVPLPRVQP